jgi:hypothetical protein
MCMSHTHAPALHRPLQKDTREAKCARAVWVCMAVACSRGDWLRRYGWVNDGQVGRGVHALCCDRLCVRYSRATSGGGVVS